MALRPFTDLYCFIFLSLTSFFSFLLPILFWFVINNWNNGLLFSCPDLRNFQPLPNQTLSFSFFSFWDYNANVILLDIALRSLKLSSLFKFIFILQLCLCLVSVALSFSSLIHSLPHSIYYWTSLVYFSVISAWYFLIFSSLHWSSYCVHLFFQEFSEHLYNLCFELFIR